MNKFIIIISLLLVMLPVNAQQVISAAGFEAKGISWTIGELITETIITSDATLTQGFYQPNEITIVGIETIRLEMSLHVYPNPVTDALTISCEDSREFTWQLTNMAGQKTANGKSVRDNEVIDMTNYPAGNYVLTVTSQQKTRSTIIIKK